MHNYLLTEGLSHDVLHFQVVCVFFLFFHKQMTSEEMMDGEMLHC